MKKLLTIALLLIASIAYSQPELIETASSSVSSASKITVALSDVPPNGSLLILGVSTTNSTATTPTGWTLIQNVNLGNTNNYIWYRIAGSYECFSYTVTTSSSSDNKHAFIALVTGQNATPFGTNFTRSQSSLVTSPSNILSSPVSISSSRLVLFSFMSLYIRDQKSLTDGFSVIEEYSSERWFLGGKYFSSADNSTDPVLSWDGMSQTYSINWIEIK